MPRFYFDVREADNLNRDTDGLELPSIKEARDQASMALSTMLKDAMPDGPHLDMAIEVRGDDSRALFKQRSLAAGKAMRVASKTPPALMKLPMKVITPPQKPKA